MSRQGGNKSKQDKSSAKTPASGNATVAALHDFIPNRFNLSDWISLTRDEDDNTFIGDLVDDIVTTVLDKCEKVHLKKQLMPYTLSQTKNVLLQLVQWHFIAHDVGEQNVEDWQEEKEPKPSVIDSWAQGSVPVVVDLHSSLPSSPTKHETKRKSRHKENKVETGKSGESTQSDLTSLKKKSTSSSKEEVVKRLSKTKKEKSITAESSSRTNQGEVRSDSKERKESSAAKESQKEVSLSADKSNKSATNKGGRSADGVVYDSDGYIVRLQKIDARKLPDYQVSVSFRVVSGEPENEKKKKEEEAIQNKLNRKAKTAAETSRRKKSILLRNLTEKYSTLGSGTSVKAGGGAGLDDGTSLTELDPYVPTMIEAIDASPGVVVREGNVMKKGPTEEQQMLLGNSKERNARRRYLTVNVQDTTQLRLLPDSQLVNSIQRHSVLPAIPPKRNIQAS